MERGRLPYHVDLYLEGGCWKLRVNENLFNARGFKEHRWREPVQIGPAIGPEKLTRKEAQRVVWESLPLPQQSLTYPQHSSMTVVEFVENLFVPEHVSIKGLSGRTHYRAILKHVLKPEEVQRVFKAEKNGAKARLTEISDWPYLGGLELSKVRPEHVERLVSAGVAHGYSVQTVTHIRNVVSAVFSHARKSGCFHGENPASQVAVPGMRRKEAHVLPHSNIMAALELMRYPEREMTLFIISTGMNVAEICGLQWKYVNLQQGPQSASGEQIPPRTIAVRKQWYRGELGSVKIGRARDLPISGWLMPTLTQLSRKVMHTKPDDFVLVSEAGTPVNETNIASRRLKRIGSELQMPWLSWQVFRRTRKDLLHRLGSSFESRLGEIPER